MNKPRKLQLNFRWQNRRAFQICKSGCARLQLAIAGRQTNAIRAAKRKPETAWSLHAPGTIKRHGYPVTPCAD
jgi:hypothetical protein